MSCLQILVQSFSFRKVMLAVYCAERLAAHIVETFPEATVEIRHNEQKNWP